MNLEGQTYGRLRVVRRAPPRAKPSGRLAARWECVCACGNTVTSYEANMRNGSATSCGCTRAERTAKLRRTHGKSRHGAFHSWCAMIARCTKPDNPAYAYYGGRGIKVCEAWMTFPGFLADMGRSWRRGLTIERVDNSGNYEPSNCVWATRKEQTQNRRPKNTEKLDPDKVRQIRKMLTNIPRKDIASLFGVSVNSIHAIAAGRNWSHVQ